MLKIIVPVGIPGSGKSTWAKAEVAKEPSNWVRINNDDLRAMMNGSVWSPDYEKMITEARNYLIRDALKRGKNIIIDNLNINRRHFNDTCKIAKSVNTDVQVYEKAFYVELDEAIERDSKREGKAKVGADIIKKWWKESGGKQFKFYSPRVEVLTQRSVNATSDIDMPIFDDKLPTAILCDLDGTLALMNGRSPYDASTCENDLPNVPVIESIKLYAKAGYKIIFCSGREDKYGLQTKRFIEKYCENVEYKLYMRKSDDFRKDSIVKEEIYTDNIKDKYNVLLVLDDRNQVVDFWRSKGLTCFQVAPGDF